MAVHPRSPATSQDPEKLRNIIYWGGSPFAAGLLRAPPTGAKKGDTKGDTDEAAWR
jgi:hypothetical protein